MSVYSVPDRNETRRNFLRSVSVLGACAAAGCLSRLESPETQIAEVVLVNLNDKTHTIELHIERSDTRAFQTTETVPADGPQPVLTSDDGVPTAQAEYTVVASLDGGTDEISRIFPDSKAGGCYAVTVQIDLDGTFRGMPVDANSNRC